ncbi:MAG: exo-beta-N-acetylmuramidase NamZ family protein [Gemmatimonadota bacterium]
MGAVIAACETGRGAGDAPAGDTAEVRPGLEVLLSDSIHLVADRRVGLITNHTALDSDGDHAIDLLAASPEIELVALFGPEHGIRGRAAAGARVESDRDSATGLPVHSLYGETRKPTPAMLEDVQVLVFDIQDIGARYYTYVSTMALAMEAAGEAGVPFVVLDRPNPIGGSLVQGNVLDPAFATFVGMYPVPMRHGMTVGELARLFVREFGVEVELHVVPVAGWRRSMWFDQTSLPWVPPSPNMPDLESATHYPGTCLFEGTNLSVGRGTDRTFQQIGAPWLDGEALAARLNGSRLAGVRFEPVAFTPVRPSDQRFDGEVVRGVRFVVTDRKRYDPTLAGVAALLEARDLAGERWGWMTEHFDRLAGTDRLRTAIEAGRPLDEIVAGWAAEREAFMEMRGGVLLYPD